MNEDEVLFKLAWEVKEAGSQNALAIKWKMNRPELNAVLQGKRKPSEMVLKRLGLRRVVTETYEPVSSAPSPR